MIKPHIAAACGFALLLSLGLPHPSSANRDVTALGRLEPAGGVIHVAGPSRPGSVIAKLDELATLDFGNPTRLYDAIESSLTALDGIEGRRVILVFTDGDDTGSAVGW